MIKKLRVKKYRLCYALFTVALLSILYAFVFQPLLLQRKDVKDYNNGLRHLEQNNPEQAYAYFRRAIERSSDPEVKSVAFYNMATASLGPASLKEGIEAADLDTRIAQLQEAVRLNEGDKDVQVNLDILLSLKDFLLQTLEKEQGRGEQGKQGEEGALQPLPSEIGEKEQTGQGGKPDDSEGNFPPGF